MPWLSYLARIYTWYESVLRPLCDVETAELLSRAAVLHPSSLRGSGPVRYSDSTARFLRFPRLAVRITLTD